MATVGPAQEVAATSECLLQHALTTLQPALIDYKQLANQELEQRSHKADTLQGTWDAVNTSTRQLRDRSWRLSPFSITMNGDMRPPNGSWMQSSSLLSKCSTLGMKLRSGEDRYTSTSVSNSLLEAKNLIANSEKWLPSNLLANCTTD
jgi:hypothetical protein